MPKYVAPKPKKSKSTGDMAVSAPDDSGRHRVTLPVSKEILDSLQVGDTVSLEVAGTVVATNARAEDGASSCELTIQVSSIDTDSDNDDPESMGNRDYEAWRSNGGGK